MIQTPEIKKIKELLSQDRLREALINTKIMTTGLECWSLREELDKIKTEYNLMIKYAASGAEDPGRRERFIKLRNRLHIVADMIYIEKQSTKENDELYYTTREMWSHRDGDTLQKLFNQNTSYIDTIKETIDKDEQDELYKKLTDNTVNIFNYIWTSSLFTESDVELIVREIEKDTTPLFVSCAIIAALTQAIVALFDPWKFKLLLMLASQQNKEVRVRALTSSIIISAMREDRISLIPSLKEYASDTLAEDNNRGLVQKIQQQLIMQNHTDDVSHKINKEILPTMLKDPNISKIHLDINMRPSIDPKDLEEQESTGWKDIEPNPELSSKLKEVNKLIKSGADINMASFSHLKKFPFFNDMAHWFFPYNQHIAETELTEDGEEIPEALTNIVGSNFLCSSDTYSFLANIMNAPKVLRETMVQQIAANADALKEANSEKEMHHLLHGEDEEEISRTYIQDLYRFHKLWKDRSEIEDPFNKNIILTDNDITERAFPRKEDKEKIADFLLALKDYDEALDLLDLLIEDNMDDSGLLQKTGYALEMKGETRDAEEYYATADMIEPDNKWTLNRLGACNKVMGDYKRALDYYLRLEELKPDDLKTTMNIGLCHTMLYEYESALPYYYKVNYLAPNHKNAARAIAWCSLMTGDNDKAAKYYNQLTAEDGSREDWMNTGHLRQILGDIPGALKAYRKSADQFTRFNDFVSRYYNDYDALIQLGIDELQIILVPDEIVEL